MTLRAKDFWVNTYSQHTAKGIPELAEASCRGTTAHVGMRALGYDRLQLGMLHSFLALLPLLHSQLKPDGGGQREDLTPEPTSYQVLLYSRIRLWNRLDFEQENNSQRDSEDQLQA